MKAVGIVVEYNPFHNGHALHVKESKKTTDADLMIAVMSGNFLQRGEPALVPKWYRAKMALLNGVDIVVELPYSFATQKADTFAYGAISILDALGCKAICFGSESGNIDEFHDTLFFLEKKKEAYNEHIQSHLKKGVSYPKAQALAFQQLSPPNNALDLSKPNNILGIQYVNAIQKIGSPMEAKTIVRKSAQYHDEHFNKDDSIASATSIRKAIFSHENWENYVSPYIPNTTLTVLKNYYDIFGHFQNWETYWPYLQFRLLQATPEELREIYEVEEGIEHRLISSAFTSTSFQQFMEKMKTKRYTWTRLQRICVHILVNVKKIEMKKRMEQPTYIRLLGMTIKGREYIRKNKKNFPLPLISKLSSFDSDDIKLDIQAAKIYGIIHPQLLKMEYRQPPIIMNHLQDLHP